jgi:pimeloyl-ACP methyl ester carboxylesterase
MPLVERDGVRLYYEETGRGDAIVWIHEFAADCRTWEPQVRRFSRDYRCITYNARGYPPSDVPESDEAYGYEQERDDLIGLMDGLGIDKAHLVGLSMGAYTALQAALAYPDRVRSVVFSSGGSGAHKPGRETFLREMAAAADRMRERGMDAVAGDIAKGPTRLPLLGKDPRGWAEFRRYLGEHSALGSALTMKNFQGKRQSLYDFEDQLKSLDTPVLLAVGDEDDPVIEVNVFLKRTLPRAGLWIHPRTGHGMNLEEPEEYNRRIAEFLAAVERGGWAPRGHLGDEAGS